VNVIIIIIIIIHMYSGRRSNFQAADVHGFAENELLMTMSKGAEVSGDRRDNRIEILAVALGPTYIEFGLGIKAQSLGLALSDVGLVLCGLLNMAGCGYSRFRSFGKPGDKQKQFSKPP